MCFKKSTSALFVFKKKGINTIEEIIDKNVLRNIYIYIYTHIHTHMIIYIITYIYIYNLYILHYIGSGP